MLLDVGFISPIDYAKWISNLVHVTKPTGGIKICTNFGDLNKVCPKDDFPLPNINIIVDLTAGYEMLSLMDNIFHLCLWYLLLECYAFWSQEYRSNISKSYDNHFS